MTKRSLAARRSNYAERRGQHACALGRGIVHSYSTSGLHTWHTNGIPLNTLSDILKPFLLNNFSGVMPCYATGNGYDV